MLRIRPTSIAGFAVAAVTTMSQANAADLSIDDLLGRWCGTVTNYTFTKTQLTVTPLSGQSLKYGTQLNIFKVEGRPKEIQVFWSENSKESTTFTFSDDKQQLIQIAEAVGDKGPRRVFKRC